MASTTFRSSFSTEEILEDFVETAYRHTSTTADSVFYHKLLYAMERARERSAKNYGLRRLDPAWMAEQARRSAETFRRRKVEPEWMANRRECTRLCVAKWRQSPDNMAKKMAYMKESVRRPEVMARANEHSKAYRAGQKARDSVDTAGS
jgi:hypothetical protein